MISKSTLSLIFILLSVAALICFAFWPNKIFLNLAGICFLFNAFCWVTPKSRREKDTGAKEDTPP
jgi:uncharacterized membrane protein YoaK (UPF0700 family)